MRLCSTSGKRCYGTRGDAHRSMRRLGKTIGLYRCPSCGAWHVTSSRKRRLA